MSTTEFFKLFAGWPTEGEHNQRLREELHIALVNQLIPLEEVCHRLVLANPDYREPLRDAMELFGEITVLLVPAMPPVVKEIMDGYRAIVEPAHNAYCAAIQERRGWRRRTDQITQQEFDAFVQVLHSTLCDITCWIKSVLPDG